MAGEYHALGTAQSVTAGTTLTLASVVVPAGATLVVSVGSVSAIVTVTGITFGAQALTNRISDTTVLMKGSVWALANATGGTATITVTFSAAVTKKALTAFYILGSQSATPIDLAMDSIGTSTTPSTNDITTFAKEVLCGILMTNGPVEDTAGTWGNSFVAGQRDGTTGGVADTNTSVADAYKYVTTSGSYTVNKTGITSRAWIMFLVTSPVVDDVTTTLGAATATGAAGALTKTAGVVALTLGACLAVGSCLPITGEDPSTTTYNPTTAASTPPIETVATDAWTGNPFTMPQTAYIRSETGSKLVGGKYFAYYQTTAFGSRKTGYPDSDVEGKDWKLAQSYDGISYWIFGNGSYNCSIRMAIDALPAIVTSSDDVNYLFAHEEIGGDILAGIGITPSGRIVWTTHGLPDVRTPINAIMADHNFHTIEGSFGWGAGRSIYLDGVQLVSNSTPLEGDDGSTPTRVTPGPRNGYQSRIMILNGPSGLTNINARINKISTPPNILEYTLPAVPVATLVPTKNTTTLSLNLSYQLVQNIRSTPFGAIPGVDPITTAQGWQKTPYVARPAAAPSFTPTPR